MVLHVLPGTGVAAGLGMPLRDIFLAMLSRGGDPNSNGRKMPEQFSSRELNLVAQTACTGTQFLPSAGMARALVKDHSDAVVYVSSGEGATSKGEFLEALNWAARAAAAKDSCIPAANLELAVLPSVEDLERGVEKVISY